MRPLQRCDFCDEEAVGTFEIVPSELDPTDAEQRRVLLCEGCETQLDTLLEPLLARLEVGETTAASPESEAAAGQAEPAAQAGQTGNAAGNEVEDPLAGESVDEDGVGSDGETATYVDSETADPTDEPDADDGGSEATGDTGTDPEESDGVTVVADDSRGNSDDAGNGADDSQADSEDGTTIDDDGTGGVSQPPSGYSRGMRLLRNREFPMDRNDAESLVAGAYDLERREVEAIIEYALETGELDAEGDQLVRP